ncbi:MAG: sarcosine oxidase subunit delta [Pseudomonadota bacterium]
MRITCPCCGSREIAEFTYGGDATRVRPSLDDGDEARWFDYVFLRDNPRGVHREFWQHTLGCRSWLVVERNTLTHEITSVALARDSLARPASAQQQAEAAEREGQR